jgi:glycosyltransferase involved in cell wall biosynthesis
VRVLVATSFVPFHDGGASLLFDWLCAALRERGHDVEPIALPFDSRSEEYLEQLLGWRAIDLRGSGDILIALRTPSYLIRHQKKVAWFIHHHRAAYDLWGTRFGNIPDDDDGRRLRDAIRSSDSMALRECRAIFANSPIVARRLRRYNDLDAEVLYPPIHQPARYVNTNANTHGAIVFVSRITGHKRQHLAIEAMQHVRSGVRLVIAGPVEDHAYAERLRILARESPAHGRIELRLGWISEEEKVRLVSESLAVAYVPFAEDSYGYPVLEGAHASKPVVTVSDSGGCAEFVRAEGCGLVVAPVAASLAGAFDALAADDALVSRLGLRAREAIDRNNITWDYAVERLLTC